MVSHAEFVWNRYVMPSKFKKLHIIAHSAGGSCLANIQKKFSESFYERVEKLALTDSWTIGKGELTRI